MPEHRGPGRIFAYGLAVTPLLALSYVLLRPRPAWVAENDVEHGYFYNALLWERGEPLAFVLHPGTPVIFLSRFILLLSGSGFDDLNGYRYLGYLATALLLSGVAIWHVRSFLGRVPAGVVVLSLALVLAWPNTWSNYDYFGPDGLILPVAMVIGLLLWRLFSGEGRLIVGLVLLGGVVGTVLALKLTAIPVAVAALLSAGYHAWRKGPQSGPARHALWSLPTGVAALCFLLLTAPVFDRLPDLIGVTLLRTDARPTSLVAPFGLLLRHNPLYALLLSGVLVFFGVTLAWSILRAARAHGALAVPSSQSARGANDAFDYPGAFLFSTLALAGMIYTMAAVELSSAEPGVLFRNVTPNVAALPFALLVGARYLLDNAPGGRSFAPGVLQTGLLVVAVATVVVSFLQFSAYRERLIRQATARSEESRVALLSAAGAGGTLVFWDGSPGTLLGPESFHLWGNYNYGAEQFSEELRQTFPRFAWFRLRDIAALLPERDGSAEAFVAAAPSRAKQLIDRWRVVFPPPYSAEPEPTPFAGASEARGTIVIAVPAAELSAELGGRPIPALVDRLECELGSVRKTRRMVGDTEWILFIARRAAPTSVPVDARSTCLPVAGSPVATG